MKKIVLSAMAVAALSSTSSLANLKSEAAAPTLKISGNSIFNAYAVNQHQHEKNGRGAAHHIANDVSDLAFLVMGRTAHGIEYGYKLVFQAYSNAHPVVEQNYAQFNTWGGTFQVGNVVGPEDSMIEDAGAIAGGTGTFDGSYYKVFNLAAFAMRGDDNIGDTGYATKIAYYTPEICDFRFGVAYTPDTTHLGDHHLNTNSIKENHHVPGQRNLFPRNVGRGIDAIMLHNWAFGLSYKKEMGNWGINLNGAYIYADSYLASIRSAHPRKRLRHVSAYQLGTVIAYRMTNGHLVQVAGGYLDNNRSSLMKHSLKHAEWYGFRTDDSDGKLHHGNTGRAYNLGAAYTMGAYKFTGTFQNTERKTGPCGKARNRVYSVTADVVPVSGLKFYGEVDYVISNSNKDAVVTAAKNLPGGKNNFNHAPVRRNSGTVFIMGTKVSF